MSLLASGKEKQSFR